MTVIIDPALLRELRDLFEKKTKRSFFPFCEAMAEVMSRNSTVTNDQWFEYARELLQLDNMPRSRVAANIVLQMFVEGFAPVGLPGQDTLHKFLEYSAMIGKGETV